MIDGDVPTEVFLQSADHLGSQCNFRKKIQNLAAGFDQGFDEAYVNLCLSAGGDTMQETNHFFLQHGLHFFQCFGLRGRETKINLHIFRQCAYPVYRHFLHHQDTLFNKPFQLCRGSTGFLEEFRLFYIALGFLQIQKTHQQFHLFWCLGFPVQEFFQF